MIIQEQTEWGVVELRVEWRWDGVVDNDYVNGDNLRVRSM